MKTLREYMDILDEISRRDFIKGAGAAAATAAAGGAKGQFFSVPLNLDTTESDPPLPRKVKGAWNYFDKKSLTQEHFQIISRLARLLYIARMTNDEWRDSQGGRIISNGVPSKISKDAHDLLIFINDSFRDLPVAGLMNKIKKEFETMEATDPTQFKKWQEFYFKNWVEFLTAGKLLQQALTK
jgi:tRNA A37 N6-isopentenylltransferase MiaA